MDNVQIYTVVLIAIQAVLTIGVAGARISHDDGDGFASTIISSLIWAAISLPLFGRIFGWW